MEAALRIVSWCEVYAVAKESLSDLALTNLEQGTRTSLRFVWKNRSIGSSANNHAIAEAVGLIVGADTFPNLPESKRARRNAWKLLASEIQKQIGSDGWPLEQSLSYGVFVFDLVLRALRSPSARSNSYAPTVRCRSRALARCLLSFYEFALTGSG